MVRDGVGGVLDGLLRVGDRVPGLAERRLDPARGVVLLLFLGPRGRRGGLAALAVLTDRLATRVRLRLLLRARLQPARRVVDHARGGRAPLRLRVRALRLPALLAAAASR